MPSSVRTIAIIIATQVGARLAAQGTLIHLATPAMVTQAIKTDLGAQGFQLIHADEKNVLLTLDRGNVPQQDGTVAHVTLEFHVEYKQKSDGLVVRAHEELVAVGHGGTDQRKQVDSPRTLGQLQSFLDGVRDEVEAQAAAADSTKKDTTAKRDSTDR
jgi:hypothetical protein